MSEAGGKSNLFLIELMVSVLFFSLSAGVCLIIFLKAHKLSLDSRELSRALNCAHKAAECIKEDPENILVFMGGVRDGEDVYLILYDEDWRVISPEGSAVYLTRAEVWKEESMLRGIVSVMKGNRILYELEVKKYDR